MSTHEVSDDQLREFCDITLSDLPGLTYFDLNLICTVTASSTKDIKLRPAGSGGPSVQRWIPRHYHFFFHSLWYHPEGSCLVNDVVSGQATERELSALRKGELRISETTENNGIQA